MGKDNEQIFRVIKKHYLMRMNQKEIAESEGLSTATVSRIISSAVDNGYVEFTLKFPGGNVVDMEKEIRDRFGLKYVSVTKVDLDDRDIILRDIAVSVGDYLNYIIKDGDIIGVSWGYTMAKIADGLKPHSIKNGKIVGMAGGLSQNLVKISAEAIIDKFSDNFNAVGYRLTVPVTVDNAETAKILRNDTHIKEIFSLIDQANILVFGIGNLEANSTMIRYGGFTEQEFVEMKKQGYVGDICSRFFKKDGAYEENPLYNRTIGIDLEDVKKKEYRIAVVAVPAKAEALYVALKCGYITSLFIDEKTAQKLLEYSI